MKMITDSLEKVYTAMGGADTFDKTDIANGIEQISKVAGSGGGSGSGIVRLTFHEENGNVILDKTWSEIFALAQENLVFIVSSSSSIQLELVNVVSMNMPSTYFVQTVYFDYATPTALDYVCDSENGYPSRKS